MSAVERLRERVKEAKELYPWEDQPNELTLLADAVLELAERLDGQVPIPPPTDEL